LLKLHNNILITPENTTALGLLQWTWRDCKLPAWKRSRPNCFGCPRQQLSSLGN